ANTPDAVPTQYWDVWVDHDGGTHQTSCEIKGFTPFSLGAKVQDIYIDMLPQKPTAVWIAQFPKGWIGAWHENPKPQWVIPLSGRWFVETTDGERVEMGPGDASFGGDQGSKLDASLRHFRRRSRHSDVRTRRRQRAGRARLPVPLTSANVLDQMEKKHDVSFSPLVADADSLRVRRHL